MMTNHNFVSFLTKTSITTLVNLVTLLTLMTLVTLMTPITIITLHSGNYSIGEASLHFGMNSYFFNDLK